VGEAIVVNPDRAPHGDNDPLLQAVEGQLRSMLGLAPAPEAAHAPSPS
jgi:hypothetical protein